MIGPNSYKFITLEQKWEIWLGKQLRFYIESEHDRYLTIPAKNRETAIWLIKDVTKSEPLIHNFSKRWIPTLWQSEEDCLSFMKSSAEMLYIIQYVQDRYRYRMNLNMCNVIEKFSYYFTIDLLEKENKYVTHSLQYYINVNMSRLKNRKKMGALCLNRIRGFDGNIIQYVIAFLN